jgi:DNA-binding transcriptional regulator YhcF (GntR family)
MQQNHLKTDTPITDKARLKERNGCVATFQGREVIVADFARELERELQAAQEENARLREYLADMVAVAEAHGWDNAEIHNARDILSNDQDDPHPPENDHE